jgi:hypothetical protein
LRGNAKRLELAVGKTLSSAGKKKLALRERHELHSSLRLLCAGHRSPEAISSESVAFALLAKKGVLWSRSQREECIRPRCIRCAVGNRSAGRDAFSSVGLQGDNAMNSFIAYILLCASSVARSECDTRSAIDVAMGPKTSNEIACGIEAQQMIAMTTIRPREGEYIKIYCVRRSEPG